VEASQAILQTLQSDNVINSSGNEANVVDVLHDLSRSANRIAKAIFPQDSSGGNDASDNHVESLTEAVMGVTSGLCRIANAIESLADAFRDHEQTE
jgi:hypothetical protein